MADFQSSTHSSEAARGSSNRFSVVLMGLLCFVSGIVATVGCQYFGGFLHGAEEMQASRLHLRSSTAMVTSWNSEVNPDLLDEPPRQLQDAEEDAAAEASAEVQPQSLGYSGTMPQYMASQAEIMGQNAVRRIGWDYGSSRTRPIAGEVKENFQNMFGGNWGVVAGSQWVIRAHGDWSPNQYAWCQGGPRVCFCIFKLGV